MTFTSWVDLRERCPVDISDLVSHAKSFKALVGIKITAQNLNRAKNSLGDARGELDLILDSIKLYLSNREILKSEVDRILYGWLTDNISRHLGSLDGSEQKLLDELESDGIRVNVSRLLSFAKLLKRTHLIIYGSFLASIIEYENLQEGKQIISPERKEVTSYVAVAYDIIKKKVIKEEGKPMIIKKGNKPVMVSVEENLPEEIAIIEKNKRTFLYILFQKFQLTMSTVGGLAREGKPIGVKKGSVGSYPTTWQSLMTIKGQREIAEKNKEETGEEIKVDESMIDNSQNEYPEDIDENTIYYEETEEGEDDQ